LEEQVEPVSARESVAGQGISDTAVLPRPEIAGAPAQAQGLSEMTAAGTLPDSEVTVPPMRALMDAVFGEGEDESGWQDRAVCAQTDPDAFFPEKGGSTREAKRVCRACEVRAECLEYALDNDERFGIWGGLSERERRRIKRQAG
jgi:WhiB family redox-sensing transcriptional regulator